MTAAHFYAPTLAFLAGVGFCTLMPLNIATVLFVLVLASIFSLLSLRAKSGGVRRRLVISCLLLLGFALGGFRMEWWNRVNPESVLAPLVGETVTVNGVVMEEPSQREKTLHLKVKTTDTNILVLADRYSAVKYGDAVVVTGRLTVPEVFETDLDRTFNYPDYLRAKGITYRISFAEIEIIHGGQGNPVIAALLDFKNSFTSRLRTVVAEPGAGLAEGLLLGVKQALGEELETAFRKTGIIHIVVLSGYNVMLVVAFVWFVLSYFLPPWPRTIIGIIAIVSFALLVGPSATVVRASLMAILLLLAQVLGRTYLVLRGLVLAGVVMVVLNPLVLLYDIGFQLSFLATLGLILIAPILDGWLTRLPDFVGAKMFVVATVATQIAVLPLLLYQIGEFSLVAVVVNVLVLPMVPVAMFLTFLTGMTAFVSPFVATGLAFPTHWSLLYIIEIARWFGDWPLAALAVPRFPLYLVPILYFLMGLWLWRALRARLSLGVSELGEQLLRKTNTSTTALSGWTIHEEVEKEEVRTNRKMLRPEDDPPIFFR